MNAQTFHKYRTFWLFARNRVLNSRRRIVLGPRNLAWKLSGRTVVHFLHIGKTGGTALGSVIERHPRTPTCLLLRRRHGTRLEHVPAGEKVVFVLRDPLTRFVSAFHARKWRDQPRLYLDWNDAEAEAFGRFETPDDLGRALASPDIARRQAAEQAMRGIRHVQTSFWDWFGDEVRLRARLGDILYVARQETLQEDFDRLKELLMLPKAAGLPRGDLEAHRGPHNRDRRLSEAAREALTNWYAEDYAFIRLCEELTNLRPMSRDAGS